MGETAINEKITTLAAKEQRAAKATVEAMCGSRGGGAGGPDPPEKSQKYRVSKQYWSGSPEKLQGYKASIQCWVNINTPAKRHLYGVLLAGR